MSPAESFARRAHVTQTDKAGRPYTGHLMRVAAQARAHAEALGWPEDRCQLVADVAWLHDIGDTPTTLDDMLAAGIAPEAARIALTLHRHGSIGHRDNVRWLIEQGEPISLVVKRADAEDWADPANAVSESMTKRYATSAALLRAAGEGMRQAGGSA